MVVAFFIFLLTTGLAFYMGEAGASGGGLGNSLVLSPTPSPSLGISSTLFGAEGTAPSFPSPQPPAVGDSAAPSLTANASSRSTTCLLNNYLSFLSAAHRSLPKSSK